MVTPFPTAPEPCMSAPMENLFSGEDVKLKCCPVGNGVLISVFNRVMKWFLKWTWISHLMKCSDRWLPSRYILAIKEIVWSRITIFRHYHATFPNFDQFSWFLQGKIQEDVIYGVCLPATGFSALFVLLALMTVVSVIVSAFICYHRQLAKVAEEAAPEPTAAAAQAAASINPGTVQTSLMLKEFNAWFRKQHQQHPGMYPQWSQEECFSDQGILVNRNVEF